MARMFREFLGDEGTQVEWKESYSISPTLALTESFESNTPISKDSIMVDIEGIHAGPTRNFTWYTDEALKSSIPTWTHPYLRPMIMHHNEKNGKIIGRVRAAAYKDKGTLSETGAIIFTVNIPDKDGKEQVLDGRLKTVSIGVIVHDCRCSICGANIAEMSDEELEEHEHKRGGTYEVDGVNKTCYWVINKMEAKELSYVIVPSDIYAQNINIYKPSTKKEIQESKQKGVLDLAENLKEEKVIDEVVKPEDPKPVDPKPEDNTEVEDLKKKITELEVAKAAVEKELADIKVSNEDVKKQLETADTMLNQTKVNLKTAQDNLVLKEAEVIRANQLRESAETDLVNCKAQIKENMIDSVMTLRESLNKPAIDKETLASRSQESLQDALKDLKEEMGTKGPDVTKIEKTENPGLVENFETNSKKDVKETKTSSNIDIQEQMKELMSNLFYGNRNY